MNNGNKGESFEYTYSASRRDEVKKIRDKYIPREEDKMEQLRRLDAGVTRKGTTAALAVGIIGSLILGIGMCCCMVWDLFIPGIGIGAVGIIGVVLSYPVYVYMVETEREKIAPEIIRLTDELMK